MPALLHFFTKDAASAAWAKIRANGKRAAGADGVTIEQFKSVADDRLSTLVERVCAGQYRPVKLLRMDISSSFGKTRTLRIPAVIDRIAQRIVVDAMTPVVESLFHDHSFAYRPHRSSRHAVVKAAALAQQGYDWCVDIDIAKFFDTIGWKGLIGRLRSIYCDSATIRLIQKWIGAKTDGDSQPPTRGIPQGGPLSPILANLVLDELDWLLDRREYQFVRYADDLRILEKSKAKADRAREQVTALIEQPIQLTVNRAKTTVSRLANRPFLGFVLCADRSGFTVPADRWKAFWSAVNDQLAAASQTDATARLAELRNVVESWWSHFGWAVAPGRAARAERNLHVLVQRQNLTVPADFFNLTLPTNTC